MDPPLRVREDWWVFEKSLINGKEGQGDFRKNLRFKGTLVVFEKTLKFYGKTGVFQKSLLVFLKKTKKHYYVKKKQIYMQEMRLRHGHI